MTDQPKWHVIAEPYPETIGVTALTIFAPEDFCGDVEITWWYPGKNHDADRQRMTCSYAWLLQGVYHDVRGSRPREDLLGSGRVVLQARDRKANKQKLAEEISCLRAEVVRLNTLTGIQPEHQTLDDAATRFSLLELD
jgi:hypothetical protein